MSMDKLLCVEIRVPLKGGGNEFTSAYLVSQNRVLCCHHGLFPEERDPKGAIHLAWRKADLTLDASDQVPRDQILWANEAADLAVLEWDHGDQPQAKPSKDAEIHGAHGLGQVTQWTAMGFLGSQHTDDHAGQPRLLKPHGRAPTGFDEAPKHNLTCGGDSEQPEQGEHWGGFSGAPVFDLVAKKILGVVTHWDEPMGAKGLRCTLLSAYLQSPDDQHPDRTLADSLKLKAPEDLAFVRGWFMDRFVASVKESGDLEQAIRQAYAPALPHLDAEAELRHLAEALLSELNPEQRVEGLEDAFNRLLAECDSATATNGTCDQRTLAALGRLARLMFVLVFEDYSVVRQARLDLQSNNGLLSGHSRDRLDTEALLAAVDGAPPRVEVHQGRLYCTYDLTADPDRQGLDADGWQAMSDFAEEVMANTQSGEAAYLGGVEPGAFRGKEADLTAIAQGTTPGDLSDTGFYSLTSYAERIAFVADRLRRAARRSSRSYYVHLSSSEEESKTRKWQEFRRLSNNSLTLVKTSGAACLSVVSLISVLQDIIITAEKRSQ